ncbi:MAG: TAXI family TRAP transporter solute-binding subunit [Alphaproteobacteria bacterium]|nr:TAXI family TRAP transporter solute-binding subunit [Alphaproteobacteria bacterium]
MRQFMLVAMAAAMVAGWSAARAQSLSIGTTPPGTMMFALGNALSKTLADADIASAVQPQGGTGVLIPMVNAGGLDLGFCGTPELYDSFHGVGSSEGKPNPNLRAIGILFPNRFALFVRKDSSIETMQDLRGRRVPYDFTDQASSKGNIDALLANAGMTIQDVQPVTVKNLIDNVDALIQGRTDVAFFALGQAKVAEADKAVGGIRFLAVSAEPDAVAGLRKFIRTGYVGKVNPAVDLPGVLEPLAVAQYDVIAVVNAAMPAKLVTALLRVFIERRDALAIGMPLFRGLVADRMYQNFQVPYHDAAVAFYYEQGVKPAP